MVPISWPPVDCQTFCPLRMFSPVKSTRPSADTTLLGIGGPLLIALYPTPPSTAKEISMTNPNAIHSFLYCIKTNLQECLIHRLPSVTDRHVGGGPLA